MTTTTADTDSGYAWARLFAALLLTTVGCAGMYIAMVAVPVYQSELAVGRGAASLPYTLVMLGFGIGGICIGWLVDRHGIVRVLAACVVGLTGALLAAGMTRNYLLFSLLHLLIGALGCGAVFSPLLADISRWFVTRRGFAIAACASGNYLAGALWPPVIEALLNAGGLATTYVTFALLSAVLMLPLLLALRRKPGLEAPSVAEGGSAGSPRSLGFSANSLTALLCVAGLGCCAAMAMPQVHVVALAMDRGFTMAEGALMLSIMFGCGIVSRLVFGWISDSIGGLATLLVGSALQASALALFLPVDTVWALYLVCALFGLFQGGIVPCYALIIREYFPAAEAATRTGIVIFATLVGMAYGAWASGAIHDLTGSYQLAFLHGIGWNVLNMLVVGMLLLRSRRALSFAGSTPG